MYFWRSPSDLASKCSKKVLFCEKFVKGHEKRPQKCALRTQTRLRRCLLRNKTYRRIFLFCFIFYFLRLFFWLQSDHLPLSGAWATSQSHKCEALESFASQFFCVALGGLVCNLIQFGANPRTLLQINKSAETAPSGGNFYFLVSEITSKTA